MTVGPSALLNSCVTPCVIHVSPARLYSMNKDNVLFIIFPHCPELGRGGGGWEDGGGDGEDHGEDGDGEEGDDDLTVNKNILSPGLNVFSGF